MKLTAQNVQKVNAESKAQGQTLKLPLRFEPQDTYIEHAKLLGKALEPHEGYFRENSGAWVIADSEGLGIITVRFRGKAKRGEAWNAPDPEGQAIARMIVSAVNSHEELVLALRRLLKAYKELHARAGGDYTPATEAERVLAAAEKQ